MLGDLDKDGLFKDITSEFHEALSGYGEALSDDYVNFELAKPGEYDFNSHEGNSSSMGELTVQEVNLNSTIKAFEKIHSLLKIGKIREGGIVINSENLEDALKNPTSEKYKALIEYIHTRERALNDIESEFLNLEMDKDDVVEFFIGLVNHCK